MKKMLYSLLAIGLLCVPGFAGAEQSQATATTALRPTQKAMQARAGRLKAMTENLDVKKYRKVKNQAKALASETAAAGVRLPDSLARELTMNVSTLATAVADAAGRKDGETARIKLAGIKAACGECHARIRDKK
jgi:hypothetical protein